MSKRVIVGTSVGPPSGVRPRSDVVEPWSETSREATPSITFKGVLVCDSLEAGTGPGAALNFPAISPVSKSYSSHISDSV